MFLSKQTPPPPPPEPSGIKIEVNLSETTVIKLISIAVAVLLGSGVWVAQSTPLSGEAPLGAEKVAPDRNP